MEPKHKLCSKLQLICHYSPCHPQKVGFLFSSRSFSKIIIWRIKFTLAHFMLPKHRISCRVYSFICTSHLSLVTFCLCFSKWKCYVLECLSCSNLNLNFCYYLIFNFSFQLTFLLGMLLKLHAPDTNKNMLLLVKYYFNIVYMSLITLTNMSKVSGGF